MKRLTYFVIGVVFSFNFMSLAARAGQLGVTKFEINTGSQAE